MKKAKIIMIAAAVLLAAAAVFLLLTYHVIDGQLYRKDADFLDLRGQTVTREHYERVCAKLPDCEIAWDVPFQGGQVSWDATELTVNALSEADLEMLAYFPELKTLDASGCEELSLLPEIHRLYPELKLRFSFQLDGLSVCQDTKRLVVSAISREELALLDCLGELTEVTVTGGGDTESLEELRIYCDDRSLAFRVLLDGQVLDSRDKALIVANATDDQVELMRLMPWLEEIHLPEPEADVALLLNLVEALPETEISWKKTILGLTFDQDTESVDLTPAIALGEGEVLGDKTAYDYGLVHPVLGTEEEDRCSIQVLKWHPLPDKSADTEALIAEVEAAMEYFPKAKYLRMCGAWLSNEAMADFREAHREQYKVAWSVQCGRLATRTDATFFMPAKYHVYYFKDADAYNLRYCEDIVSMDIGHMLVSDLEFLRYMPNLQYLILSWTDVRDLSALSSCKNLRFLEINWIGRTLDYTPLLECTALEDLNVGQTYFDVEPLLKMTWLKNLWMVKCGLDKCIQAQETLTDTNVVYAYPDPVVGWRALPNYFAMRDELFMYYMRW